MANDGTVKIGTDLDKSGLEKGLSGLGGFAKKGFSVIGDAAAMVSKVAVTAIGAATSAAAALGAASVKTGMDFDAAVSQIAATMGVTVDEIGELRNKAKELGAATSFSATQAAEGLNILAMSGLDAEQQLGSIEPVLNLAAAGALSLDSAAAYATGAMKGFGLEVEDVTHITNLMAKGATLANTDVNGLGEALSGAAAGASTYGQSIETTTVSLLRLAEQNQTGSAAATALAAAMKNLYAPTDQAKEALKSLGVSAYDTSGNARDFNDVVDDLNAKLSELTTEERADLETTIFGIQGKDAFDSMVKTSTNKVEEFKTALSEADIEGGGIGAAAAQAATQLDNLKGDITIFQSALEGLEIEISDSLSGSAREIVQFGTDALGQLTEAFQNDGYSGLIEAGSEIIANVIMGATQALPGAVKLTKEFIRSLKDAIFVSSMELRSSGPEIVRSLVEGALSIATDMAAVGLRLMSVLADSIAQSSPEIVSGLGGFIYDLIYGIYEHFPDFLEAGKQILTNIMLGLTSGKDECIPNIMAMGAEMLSTLINGISEMLPGLIQMGVGVLLSFVSGILDGDNISKLIDAGLDMLLALAQGVADSLPELIEQVPRIINSFADEVYSALPKILLAGIKILFTLGKGIIDSIPTIIANAGEITKAIINVISLLNLWSAGKNIISGLGNGIKSMAAWVKDIAKQIVEQIKHPFSAEGWASLGSNIISGIANGIKNGASKIADAAKNAAKSALDAAKNFLGIHSPSRVMRDVIGKNMIAGINSGILEETPELEKTSVQSASRAVQSMQGVVTDRSEQIGLAYAGKLPDVTNPDKGGGSGGITRRLEVPVFLDAREVARGIAEYTDEQIAWEGL